MSGLSNFFKSRDPATALVRPVGAGEIEPALRMLLGSGGQPCEPHIAADFEHLAAHRRIDLTALQIALMGDRLIAAALPVHSPGGTSLLMLSTSGGSAGIAKCISRCAAAVIDALRPGPPLLVQTLLEVNEAPVARALQAIDFETLATLIYLQRPCDRPIPAPTLPPGLTQVLYSPQTHDLFCEAVTATYAQSLDCPPLHGRRAIEDVIAGHKGSGEFDPNLWICLLENGRPVAPLLLSRVSGHPTMELVYVGLAPSARGRHIGDYLIKRALHETHVAGLRLLTLAVDAGNTPALRLYHRHGLAEVHRRLALMRTLP